MSRIIKANATQRVEVLLCSSEERRIVTEYLCHTFGLSQSAHLHEGAICEWVEQGGHNNDSKREIVPDRGRPTTSILAAVALLTYLREHRFKE